MYICIYLKIYTKSLQRKRKCTYWRDNRRLGLITCVFEEFKSNIRAGVKREKSK